MKTPEERKQYTPRQIFRGHVLGIIAGNALGAVTWVLIHKWARPLLDPDGSLQDTLGKLVGKLPDPDPARQARPSHASPPRPPSSKTPTGFS